MMFSRTIWTGVLAAMAMGTILSSQMRAATVPYSVNPTADTFVSANNPDANYGAAGAIEVSGSTAATSTGTKNGLYIGLLKFNLSGLNTTYGAGNYSLQDVKLQLTATSPNNGIFNANVAGLFSVTYQSNDGWSEGTGTPAAPANSSSGVTYNTLLSTYESSNDQAAGTFTFAGGNSGTAVYTLTLTSGISSDILSGDGIVSLRVATTDPSSAVSYLFNSVNFGTATSRPLLTADVVTPEPACGCVLAVTAYAALRRRKRIA